MAKGLWGVLPGAIKEKVIDPRKEPRPFMRFGIGINGYFALFRSLIIAYTILSIIAMVQMNIFYNAGQDDRNKSYRQAYQNFFSRSDFMLSSYPFSRPICR